MKQALLILLSSFIILSACQSQNNEDTQGQLTPRPERGEISENTF